MQEFLKIHGDFAALSPALPPSPPRTPRGLKAQQLHWICVGCATSAHVCLDSVRVFLHRVGRPASLAHRAPRVGCTLSTQPQSPSRWLYGMKARKSLEVASSCSPIAPCMPERPHACNEPFAAVGEWRLDLVLSPEVQHGL